MHQSKDLINMIGKMSFLKNCGTDSDEKNRKTSQKYEFPIIWIELV